MKQLREQITFSGSLVPKDGFEVGILPKLHKWTITIDFQYTRTESYQFFLIELRETGIIAVVLLNSPPLC